MCQGKYLSTFEKLPTTKNFIRKNQQLTKLKTQFLWHTLRTTGAMHGTSGFFSLIWRSHPKAPHMAQSSEKFRRSLPYQQFQSCFSVVVAYIPKVVGDNIPSQRNRFLQHFYDFFHYSHVRVLNSHCKYQIRIP